jgi:hypothetical protein
MLPFALPFVTSSVIPGFGLSRGRPGLSVMLESLVFLSVPDPRRFGTDPDL